MSRGNNPHHPGPPPGPPEPPPGSCHLDPDKVPETILEAAVMLYEGLDKAGRDHLAQPARIQKLEINGEPAETRIGPSADYHFGMGRWLRNSWSLWEDTPLRRHAIEHYGIAHGDDLSGLIWEIVEALCRGESLGQAAEELEPSLERIRKHWARSGQTPLTAAGLEDPSLPELKIAIAVDNWKLRTFLKILKRHGLKPEQKGGLTKGTSILHIKSTNKARVGRILEECQRECRRNRPGK